MASLNKVFLIGNLTRDPELRYTPSGTAVGELNLASTQKFTGKNGVQRDNVVYVRVTVWGKQAEACGQYLSKGSSLFVEGRLQLDTWESKDGQKRSRLSVVAQRVQFLGRPKTAARGTESVSQDMGMNDSVENSDISDQQVEDDFIQNGAGREEDPPF